jgi:hypothetical protein
MRVDNDQFLGKGCCGGVWVEKLEDAVKLAKPFAGPKLNSFLRRKNPPFEVHLFEIQLKDVTDDFNKLAG